MSIKSYKGFKPDMTCRTFQFEHSKEFIHTGPVKACSGGFHSCEYPLDVFGYYAPGTSVYAEVEQDGDVSREGGDSKIASSIIRIKGSLSIGDMVKAAIDYTFARVKPADGAASNTGELGAASNTGTRGAASNTGTRGAASNTGELGAASNTGTRGAASNTGELGAASNTGTRGAASNTGTRGAAADFSGTGKVKGIDGSALFATERDFYGNILSVGAAIVGKTEGVKADTWYTLKAGKFVVATN